MFCLFISELSPKHNRQIDGGAMQITFCKLSIDFYPFHEAGRSYWKHSHVSFYISSFSPIAHKKDKVLMSSSDIKRYPDPICSKHGQLNTLNAGKIFMIFVVC